MGLDAWLPIGFILPDGADCGLTLSEGNDWQVVLTRGGGRALVAKNQLLNRWIENGLLSEVSFEGFNYDGEHFGSISTGPSQVLCPVAEGKAPDSKSNALAFAIAMRETRQIDSISPIQDAIYIEKLSRLLPTYSITSKIDDDIVLGYWLTGGINVSVKSFRRIHQILNWLDASHLKEIIEIAGFDVLEMISENEKRTKGLKETNDFSESPTPNRSNPGTLYEKMNFELPGRPELETFFNEHIIDIVRNRVRYQTLGIGFPSAIVLHGPPGCGKTFAVDRLVDFLGWPSFHIDASSVASPFIHETSKKVSDIFEKAIENKPSVLIIDEMEAFLADREIGSGHHRVEEMAEFLRRIPEAIGKDVLIIAMTNRIELIDSAILRRGRFDHIIKVDYASENEIISLMQKLLASLPTDDDVDAIPLAKQLIGRPLSDVVFIIREASRLSARLGRSSLDQPSLLNALKSSPVRGKENKIHRQIGFI